ncbi:3-phosphoshikimate 1-carboxyvinyltransferase [Pseudogemmatithrix spongiicola]|uniref:3-phosphoshikimate 1-carboxyvinyltransferase n=1 Tax=Pseudogemmatithrix spongiicola TaxID=3062599 RepID=A0AA49K079_9BACT|nr:3-phosphoshikimate 1-carboxyvinyltransferase [Gemmatimonadaceae bacterium 'strain 138']WKW15294.1 3-phosphoshikimate 1-carboxyvinyltransferase [Gemmatimonadaceae bacterium 'strain 318']
MTRIRVPGDKSISHRALMLAALGRGTSRVRGILQSADIEATARVLRALGATIPPLDASELVIEGVGLRGLQPPSVPLDCANSGTTARLVAGIVAGAGFDAEFVGDASLSRRPMGRVAAPLRAMGIEVTRPEHGGLPMRLHRGSVQGVTWRPAVASAQVKSAVLLAGLVGNVPVEVQEPVPTRDHTERMLQARGVDLRVEGDTVSLLPAARLDAADVDVPGDPSSAAFIAGLAALGALRREVRIENVDVNPWRVGGFRALRRMGALLRYEDEALQGGEPVATVVCGPGALQGISIAPEEVPSLIDELPLLAVVAARAAGETRVTGAAELRVKESDRIAAVVSGLRAVGVYAEELPDGFVVRGSDRPLTGRVVTHGDHRIAMAFGVLGAVPGNAITVDDPSCCAVSWPSFWDDLQRLTHD